MSKLAVLKEQFKNGTLSRRQFMEGAAALGLTVSAGALLAAEASAATPHKGGRLRLGLGHGSTTDSLDPSTYANDFTNVLSNTLGNQLTEISPSGELIPELAESFEATPDAKTWTFKLRKGVEFHNGKSLTADDVVTSFQYHLGEDSRSGAKGLLTQVETFRKDGDDTVIFELSAGNADFPFVCSDYHIAIFPEKDGKLDWQSGHGTGPYRLENFEPGVRARFKRNPNYWKEGRQHVDEVEMLSILDAVARQNAVQTGEVDVIDKVEPKTAHLLENSPKLRLLEVTGTLHYSFPMRANVAPFDNNDLRLAIKYSVDREEMLQKVLSGHGSLGNDHPISPANRYHAAGLPQRGIDIDKAKFHLKKSGLSSVSLDLSASDAAFIGATDAAVLIQESAAKAGIAINVIREPKDGYWSNVWNTKPWCAAYWSGRPTEDWMFSVAYAADAKWNDTVWVNDHFNELLVAARAELDEAKRRTLYEEMQSIVREDGATLIPMFANHIMALRDNVAHAENVSGTWGLDGGKIAERWWLI